MVKSPEFLDLNNLLHGRLFIIPQYQRPYSWKTQQRKDLLNDIKVSYEKNHKTHYMATVVGLNQKEPFRIIADEYQRVDIVDGQQRITTLIMLYKAISRNLDETDVHEKYVKKDFEEMLVKQDETSTVLLQTNHDLSSHFVNYIRKGAYDKPDQAKTSADYNLLEAIDDCEKFVEQWKKNGNSLIELALHIRYKLKFVYHEIDDESLVYSVFEVLNSRGLVVSWFDRLKTMLMGLVFDQGCNTTDTIDEIHRRWSDIFRIIGITQIDSKVLCFAATLLDNSGHRVLFDEQSAKLLIKKSEGGCDKIILTIEWIEKVARSVKTTTNKYEYAGLVPDEVRLVTVAIDLRDDLDENVKSELRRYWQKVIFCIYGICRMDGRTRIGGVQLAYNITVKKFSLQKIKDSLSEIISTYNVDAQIDQLARTNCYNAWSYELRYLLYRYEMHLADVSGQKSTNDQWNRIWEHSAYTSIEHILSRSTGGNFIHWLGNLFLLPPHVNSQLHDDPPIKKLDEYKKTGFLMARDIIPHLSEWNEDRILKRGEKIARWVKQEWGNL